MIIDLYNRSNTRFKKFYLSGAPNGISTRITVKLFHLHHLLSKQLCVQVENFTNKNSYASHCILQIDLFDMKQMHLMELTYL